MRRITRIAAAAVLAAALLTQTGCLLRKERIREPAGAVKSEEERAVSLDGAKTGEVVLMMGAGDLNVAGGAGSGNLIDADFSYRPSSLAPVIEPASLGSSHRQVIVRNQRRDGIGDFGPFSSARFRNVWDIRVTEEVPITQFSISMGAGDGDVDLRDVDVEKLTLNMGAGDATVDLSGDRTLDMEGRIQAGAGEITVRLPKDVGVRVRGALDGLGEWSAPGFERDGDDLVNDAYETADVKIELTVQRGVGETTLELVD